MNPKTGVAYKIKIIAMEDGSLKVNGIPGNPETALNVMHAAIHHMMIFFLKSAAKGTLRVEEKSAIIKPSLVIPMSGRN